MNSTRAAAPLPSEATRAEARSLPAAQRSTRPEVNSVGVIGLGRMGQTFAQSLLAAGFEVVAFNRDPRRAGRLLLDGAKSAGLLTASDAGIRASGATSPSRP